MCDKNIWRKEDGYYFELSIGKLTWRGEWWFSCSKNVLKKELRTRWIRVQKPLFDCGYYPVINYPDMIQRRTRWI